MPIAAIAMVVGAVLYILWPFPRYDYHPPQEKGIAVPHVIKSEWDGMVDAGQATAPEDLYTDATPLVRK